MAKNKDIEKEKPGDFQSLVKAIETIHNRYAGKVKAVVNVSLTVRNWLIGWFVHTYEQRGLDRAAYGDDLFGTLSERLKKTSAISYHPRELRRCREFYTAYPVFRGTLSPEINEEIDLPEDSLEPIRGSLTPELGISPEKLIQSLSYSHFVELIPIENPLKRAFYEIECIRGNWSVRELKRQVATLYFERSGLSEDPEKLSEIVNSGIEQENPRLDIRDPYVFEFLGLRSKDAVMESDLEAALVAHLREFLLELGNGFCLEAQQKSIVIGNTRGFVDLVFYHRVLKCHILIELKVDAFTHEHIGQLNTYVSWYRKNMMEPGDNPPIGLLLCTQKDHALVEYALSAVDNKLFVSKYQLELPKEEELQRFLEEKRKEIGEQ
jgi:predicted nuclease of restriction endonuclease-like (RecB) superfamily